MGSTKPKPQSKPKPRPNPKPKTQRKGEPGRTRRIAAQKAAGATVSQIAAEEGISRQWASAQANSDEVRQIITAMVDARVSRLDRLFDLCLDSIEECLTARKTVVLRGKDADGYTETTCDCGPDHFAAMAAVKRYLEVITAGRPTPKPNEKTEERRGVTLDELRTLLAQQSNP